LALSYTLATPVVSRFICFFFMVGPSSIRWRHVCSASIPMLFLVHVVVLRVCTRLATGVLTQGYRIACSDNGAKLMRARRLEFDQLEEDSKYENINSSQVEGTNVNQNKCYLSWNTGCFEWRFARFPSVTPTKSGTWQHSG
jgi:hypothetical protein